MWTTKDGNTIPREAWAWVAIYKDGTKLKQFEDDNTFHNFHEIEQDKLAGFLMKREDGLTHTLFMPEGAKLIHYYDNYIFEAATEAEKRVRLYVYGYEIGGVKVLNFIMPNGTIITTDNPDNVKLHRNGDSTK